MNMRRAEYLILILLLVAVTAVLIVGCSSTSGPDNNRTESPFQLIWQDAPDKTVAVLINQPTAEQLTEFASKERLVLEESNEGFLLLPAKDVEEFTIWELEFNGSDFFRKKALYTNFHPDEEFVLDLQVMRPEGGPHYELAFITERSEVTYYIAYDGKDGNPNIEYVKEDE